LCSRASPSTRTSRSARGSRAGHAKKSINGFANALELFPELAERRKQPARSLSGGQHRMLALARVLMHDPKILLIDELSIGLAPVVVQRMLELVDELRRAGRRCSSSSSPFNVALAMRDRASSREGRGAIRGTGAGTSRT